MSDEPYTLDKLSVNPYITQKKELMMKARFKCPVCGEEVELQFTKENLKMLLRGFNLRQTRGPR